MNYFGLLRGGILTFNRLSSHHRASSLVVIRSVTSRKSFNPTISVEDENHASRKKIGFVNVWPSWWSVYLHRILKVALLGLRITYNISVPECAQSCTPSGSFSKLKWSLNIRFFMLNYIIAIALILFQHHS